jgi:hypothetical protein
LQITSGPISIYIRMPNKLFRISVLIMLVAFTLLAASHPHAVTASRRERAPEDAPLSFRRMELVQLESPKNERPQLAFYRKSPLSNRPVVVSLHSWGTTYRQDDPLAAEAEKYDWNYIHPDYGGEQWNDRSCCLPESIQEIDDAVSFVLSDAHADDSNIAVIGSSGGGTGVLASYLKSSFTKAWYFAWSPIPDQVRWYNDVRKDADLSKRYLDNILRGTHSTGELNTVEAKLKSPSHFDFSMANYPREKRLKIYAGIRDGLDGWSTSLAQPLEFYNKLVLRLPGVNSTSVINDQEMRKLVEDRQAPTEIDRGTISGRKVVIRKAFDKIEIAIFEGGHEFLLETAVRDLRLAFGESQ